ncbi:MAG: glycoside hydrolase family 3 C-terminal domain-containing protein, partial [Candidatus Bathyarchaeota archaeon]|nr:glycoside hydrolase family 3 C-terminal domain-containing protein [Candidatus Bathyarchaeota archaeon]
MKPSEGTKPLYKDPSQSVEARVEDLLGRMTLEEKIGQMCQYTKYPEKHEELVGAGKVGSLFNVTGAEQTNEVQSIAVEKSRLGIPLIFGLDVIHGYSTIYPIPLAMASSWDPETVKAAASIAAAEASSEGIRWTFAPMVDIARDPRWGRVAEGAGEDPYLGSAMARAQVEGYQGEDLADPHTIVACPKHYVAYGGAEGGRDYNTVEVSERTLRDVYLPPFKAAVEAGAGTLMSAFNDLNGVPASANRFTLTTVLREEWGFEGFVVSDWNSIGELVVHGIAGTRAQAGKEAVEAGVDMDMEGNVYQMTLASLVEEGAVSESTVDDAVRRILTIKFKLGLFDSPYIDPSLAAKVIQCKEHIEAARDFASHSMVLLKNENGLLPLKKDLKTVAVIGPLADEQDALLGCWPCMGRPEDVVTLLEGIKDKVSEETEVLYAKGCDVQGDSTEGLRDAADKAKAADVAIVVVGESREMSGEAGCRSSLDLPGVQERLVREVCETGVPVVMVLLNGRPMSISWPAEHVPAILEAWHPGIQGGNAVADLLFGDFYPCGRLPVTFPRTVGQVPIYYNHKNTGRPPTPLLYTSKYIDLPSTPLFPFGHGLGYTQFEYGNLTISPEEIKPDGEVEISLNVKNVGDREGDEVVQLYLRDL